VAAADRRDGGAVTAAESAFDSGGGDWSAGLVRRPFDRRRCAARRLLLIEYGDEAPACRRSTSVRMCRRHSTQPASSCDNAYGAVLATALHCRLL